MGKISYSRWIAGFAFIGLLSIFYLLPLDDRLSSLGDDFAQYILQAQNVCRGQPFTELPYIFKAEAFGPPTFPPVYPLLISPLVCRQPVPYFWIKTVSVLLFFLSLPILYQIFRSLSGVSLAKETLFLYPILPWAFFLGRDIGSDIPYTCFSIFALWFLITLPNNRLANVHVVLTGFCMALATLTRDIGVSLWGGSLLFYTYKVWKNPPQRFIVIFQIMLLSFAFLLPVSLWKLYQYHMGLEPVNKTYFQFIMGLNGLDFHGLFLRLVSNSYYYFQKSYELLFPLSFILRPITYLNWIRFPIATVILSILIWQMVKGLRESVLPIILYIGCFLAVLLLMDFPVRAGVRYIIPLSPFFIFFFLKGLKELSYRYWRPSSTSLYKILLFVWIGLSIWGSTYFLFLIKSPQFFIVSPESPSYQSMVSWIQKELPQTVRIAYIKPRYLALYTQRKTAIPPLLAPPSRIFDYLSHWQVTHVLLDDHFITEEKSLRETLHLYPRSFSLLYSSPPLYLFRFYP